jgi:deazaflavin-dependent oxidoreductase (nitroreductase family)
MRDTLIKLFMKVNVFLLRATKGKLGSKLGTQTVLLLHNTGRKSGRSYLTPIAFFHHGEDYLLVASNWGRDGQADWYLNLKQQSRAVIEVEGKTISVLAREAWGEERNRLWKFATERHPPYLHYQQMTTRRIPIVILSPD